MEISGKTKIFGIIADPIHHVKTPQKINKLFQSKGFDGILIPMHVQSEHLGNIMDGIRKLDNFFGLVVTVPHKTDVLRYCDEISNEAQMIGAANIVRRNADGTLFASMLDGKGFVRGLLSSGYSLDNKKVKLVGAGGAANAIAFALVQQNIQSLTLYNRTEPKALELQKRLIEYFPNVLVLTGAQDVSDYDIVINATSLGLREGDPLPINEDSLNPSQLVCDIIMSPRETPLLKKALQKNCAVHYGAPMLESQVDLMLQFWNIK